VSVALAKEEQLLGFSQFLVSLPLLLELVLWVRRSTFRYGCSCQEDGIHSLVAVL
jgi:hypothetical protein